MSENFASSQSAVAVQPARRIASRFRALGEAGEMGLVAYITAGDPSLAATEKIVLAAAKAVADGPTIQRASDRALRSGTTLAGVIELVRRIRAHSEVPLVLFSYFNPILQMGLEKFAAAAAAVGADGALATDLTPEEALEYRATLQAHGLDTIFLAAPTSTDARLAQIGAASSGFLYMISRAGVTGERAELPAELPALIRRARKFTRLPIAVGFGISLPTHVSVLGGIADAAVIGSALVAEIERSSSPQTAAKAVATRIAKLKAAARRGVSRRSAPIAPGA